MKNQRVTLLPFCPVKVGRVRTAFVAGIAGLLISHLGNTASPAVLLAADAPARALAAKGQANAALRAQAARNYGRLPLAFEPNRGQTDKSVKFLSRGRGYQLFLTQDEAVLSLKKPAAASGQQPAGGNSKLETGNSSPVPSPQPQAPDVLRMTLPGANINAPMAGVDELPGKSNYFIGRDPSQWHTQVPNYRKVAVKQVYPGIDLVYYGQERQLEYDFVVAPGADPKAIALAIDSDNSKVATSHSPRIDATGDLVVTLEGGEVRFHRPTIYQLKPNSSDQTRVEGRYVLRASKLESGNSKVGNPKSEIQNSKWDVGFEIASYDRTRPLIIDPVLSYSTYLGGSQIDNANGIAVDSTGSVFIVGETDSSDFPTAHPLQPNAGGVVDFPDDAFVTKISSQGTLVYSTYLGGANRDYGSAIAVDSLGNAYVTGTTLSPHFPATIGAFDPTCGTDGKCNQDPASGGLTSDAFVTKLNPEGSALVYSSFLGGAGNERGFGIAVDNDQNAYVTGQTDFTDFPVVNGFAAFGGLVDGFVTKVSASGAAILFSTYLGGSNEDEGYAIAVDGNGDAYVTGLTYSSDFPAGNVYGGAGDAFVSKIDTNAGALLYSTYLVHRPISPL